MVTLRIGPGVALPGAGAAWPGGDAVPDGDLVRADEDVLDEQPQDALAVFDGGGGGVAAQLGEEAFQVVSELEVGVPVGGLGVEGVDLAAQVCLPGAQVRHPRAQLIDGDQLLGERLDHGGDRGGGLGQRGLQLLALPGGRVGGAGLLEIDTGIMSGADIVASIALGAKFTLVGRAYLYGLMAGGREGVDRMIAILRDQIERTMKLLGVATLAELTPGHVTQLARTCPVPSGTAGSRG